MSFPKFLDEDDRELATLVNKIVNTVVKDEDKRHEELSGDAFLEKDAVRILKPKASGGVFGAKNPALRHD
jgi:hypothetical protein